MELLKHWILTLTIFTPVIGAILIALLPGRWRSAIKTTAILFSMIDLVLATIVVTIFFNFGPTDHYILEQNVLWLGPPILPSIEIRYHVGVDGLSVFLLGLTALLLMLSVLYSLRPIVNRIKEYYFLLLILAGACIGVFCAVDLLLFYIFFELVLIPLFLIIGIWGSHDRQAAAIKFFIYTITGSLLTLAAVLYLAIQSRQTFGFITFEMPKLMTMVEQGGLSYKVQVWVFLAMFAGFAVKVPLFPMHTWQPLAHTEAPTAGSVFLAGILLKLGTYGFLRFCLPLLPLATYDLAPWIATLSVVAILYGALTAWAQDDFKRLIAYSSISHMGFCLLGLLTIKPVGVIGGLLFMINHGLSTSALFFLVGMIYDRFQTRRMADVGGLASTMPWAAFFAVIFGLASMALPGLNGFISEFMVLVGTFTSAADQPGLPPGPLHLAFGFFAAGGITVSAIYILYFLRRLFFGPAYTPEMHNNLPRDLTRREIGVLMPLAVLVVLLGIWPGPIIRAVTPACTTVTKSILSVSRTYMQSPNNKFLPHFPHRQEGLSK